MGKAKNKRKSSGIVGDRPGPKKSKRGSLEKGRLDKEPPTELVDDSTFGRLVKGAGLLLMAGDSPNQLSVDQAMFQMNLTKDLKKSEDLDQVVEEFMLGLQNHIEDAVRFKYSLYPTVTSAECESARGGSQESLMRLLLGIDELQTSLINVLLEKLPEFMDDQDSMFDTSGAVNLPRLILIQFRWLDRVLKSEDMTNKMIEMVEVSSLAIQQEIISCIPEVVSDNEHNSVATKLKELLLSSSQLTVTILDALSNLNLTSELLIEVRRAALQTLLSADMEDLPVIIKFILQSVNSNDAVEVIGQLRANLEFPSSPASTSTSLHRRGTDNGSSHSGNKDCTMLILDAIKINMRIHKAVTDGWIKVIQNVHSAAEHRVVDIFILLIAHTVAGNRKKQLESLFRAKVRSGCFREELLKEAFSSHAQVIRDYFPAILSLAEVLLRSPEPTVSLFACCIYRQAFLAFDMYCKQEVIGSLVTHIGSGSEGEIEAGLDVLLDLVEHNPASVVPFINFIKGLLDYLANLTLPQIRKLFTILGVLAFRNASENSTIQDELHIVLRKQLSSNNLKYKRIGVIASLMILRNMAFCQGSDQTLSKDKCDEVKNLLDLIRSTSSQTPETWALFFDELANIVEQRQMDHSIQELIGESILNDFQDDFVVDIKADHLSGDYGLPLEEMYGLETEESQGGVAINLLPLVSKSERAKPDLGSLDADDQDSQKTRQVTVSPLCMAPHFRLLRICEQVQNDGNLEGIDALLGCPLYSVNNDTIIPKISSLSKSEKDMLCTCLFLTINWFREVLNAFSGLTDPEMRGKVLGRLQNITEVQRLLKTCLAESPAFNPPLANFDSSSAQDPGDAPASSGLSTSAAAGKRPRKPKEKKKTSTSNTSILDDTNLQVSTQDITLDTTQNASTENDAAGTESGTQKTANTLDMAQYRKCFRELDIDVFNVLGCGLVSRSVLDSEMQTKETVVLKLQPPELHFLLEDLSLKLEHALPASSSKRRMFLKSKADKNAGFSHLNRFTPGEIAQRAAKLLPYLCDHLESTSAFFQALIAQNDGVIDGPGTHTSEYYEMASCLHLLLKSLLSFFSWNGFMSSENRSLYNSALKILTTRFKGKSRTQFSAKLLYEYAFTYLEKFGDTVPDLPCAIDLLRLLVSLSERSETTDQHKNIADMSQGLLKREWLDQDGIREKGAKHNEMLKTLLKIYLSHTPDVLGSIKDLCTIGIQELLDSDERNRYSTTYPTLNRYSFSSYYRVMFEHLTVSIQGLYAGRAPKPADLTAEHLPHWNTAIKVFHILISLIKEFDARNNLTSALRYARIFVEQFLKYAMPLLDKLFPSQREDILALLKTLQQSTRSLHHICSHSKFAKDVALTKHVPAMKRNLELFVYRVKAMLALHNCQEAFWLGNLKNRNIHGEEILSQQGEDSVSHCSDEDNTEVPSDDSSSDADEESVTTMGQEDRDNDSDDDESYSESF